MIQIVCAECNGEGWYTLGDLLFGCEKCKGHGVVLAPSDEWDNELYLDSIGG